MQDSGSAIVVDDDGDAYVVGSARQASGQRWLVLKYGSDGDRLWAQTYAPSQGLDNVLVAAGLDASGNLYVGGNVDDSSGFQQDIAVAKYTSGGTRVWARAYADPTSADAYLTSLAINVEGGVSLTGYVNAEQYAPVCVTMAFSAAGARQWKQEFLPSAFPNSLGSYVAAGSDGSVYVAGLLNLEGSTSAFLAKYAPSGNLVWADSKLPFGVQTDYLGGLVVSPTGDIALQGAGMTADFAAAVYTACYSPSGDRRWSTSYGGSTFAQCATEGIAATPSGRIVVAYTFQTNSSQFTGIGVTTYDDDGNREWSRTYNGSMLPYLTLAAQNALTADSDGNAALIGNISNPTGGSAFIIHFNSPD